ncbi:MAG: MFS transporter, partial [Spirochaetia bacterium]|nr:MFS transporter [Spirochaetia bacterium]
MANHGNTGGLMTNTLNTRRLFFASCMALIVTAMTFAIRANIIGDLGKQFSLSHEEMGWVLGTAFWGFTLAMIFGGPLCDVLGMGTLLVIAFVGHAAGVVLTIFATGFWSLFLSTLLVGVANGMVEAACNPLVTALHPENKTEKLNHFHVWFPGGIVIGGLIAYALTRLGLGWKSQMISILIPALVYGALFLGQRLPKTERVSSGVSYLDMLKACASPLFILMVLAMLFTAATELGTGQWIAELLGNVGVPAILLLVFINGLMAMG